MNGVLNVSEAFTLGLHAACYLAQREKGNSTAREIAEFLDVSEAHLAKVMQRLSRAGIVSSNRGPKGGFRLRRPGGSVTLMDIYRCLEGSLAPSSCLLGRESCAGRECLFRGFLESVNRGFREYLENTSLEDVGDLFATGREAPNAGRDRATNSHLLHANRPAEKARAERADGPRRKGDRECGSEPRESARTRGDGKRNRRSEKTC